MSIQNLDLSTAQIKELCQRWQIIEFALFGSVLRDDFQPALLIAGMNSIASKMLALSMLPPPKECERLAHVRYSRNHPLIQQRHFQPTSDIDVLITFAPNARKGLLTLEWIKHELEDLRGRDLDISRICGMQHRIFLASL